MRTIVPIFVIQLMATVAVSAESLTNERIRHYFERATGIPLFETEAESLRASLSGANAKDQENALFEKLFAEPEFVNSRLSTFVSRLSNEQSEPYEDLDDYQVSLLLSITEDRDFRDVFMKSYFIENKSDGLIARPAPSTYATVGILNSTKDVIEQFRLNLGSPGGQKSRVLDGYYQDGLFTTNGFGRRFIADGTNRRPIRAAYDILLCSPIETWADSSLSPFWIGGDIDRKPGDSHQAFVDRCSSCHSPMDSQRGSFAYYDYDRMMNEVRRLEEVARKYNQNRSVFPDAEPTIDDSWENLLTTSVYQKRFGWRGPKRGRGVKSFARMIVDSRQFQVCMTQKLVQEFCDVSSRDLVEVKGTPIFQSLADGFRDEGYRVKSLIRNIIKSDLCR
ncbi:MAG: hypothetical protein AB7G93_01085 [Bdellovibrionales bacterium]